MRRAMCRFLARGAVCLSGALLLLALMSSPGVMKADDDPCGCATTCAQYNPASLDYQFCMYNCTSNCNAFNCSTNTAGYCASYNDKSHCEAPPTNCYTSGDGKQNCNCTWNTPTGKAASCDCQ